MSMNDVSKDKPLCFPLYFPKIYKYANILIFSE